MTIPRNKLISYPGLEPSPYAPYEIGKPVSFYRVHHYLGVDPVSGLYQFLDAHECYY